MPAQSFTEQFDSLRGELPGAALPWLRELRDAGIERFGSLGLPGPKEESWKYTRLRPLEQTGFAPAPAADTVSIDRLPALFPQSGMGHRVIFVNGRLRQCISFLPGELPEGAELGGLAEALGRDPEGMAERLGRIGRLDGQSLLALNTAMMRDGLLLRVKAGVTIPLPIEVVYVGAAGAEPISYHPRNLIVLEPGSRATVVEHHVGLGEGAYFANSVTEILVQEDAELHHYKVQEEGPEAVHIATLHARLERGAVYDSFTLSTGAKLARNEASVQLAGPGAECHLNGAYMLRGKQHWDTTSVIDHLTPHTTSREVFKGVVDDEARAVFQGRITVHPGAQKSNGHQLSKALLLSDRAEVDAKPELEIYADDVKCSHGAATGDLDHEALFYLRSRGIPESTARHMLIEAFLGETINGIAAEGLCPALMASVGHWLSRATNGERS
ncbi:MAG: Fe-S cluster assembly protein SufD [Kiloniellales bacterium]